MARLQDFPSVTPTSSDKILIVQSQGQGLAPHTIKLDSENPTGTGSLSLNRKANTTTGSYSVAEGRNCTASGNYGSHAEGYQTEAQGEASHAEGSGTKATSNYSHAEGYQTTASGLYSHVEGQANTASAQASHAEGRGNVASNSYAHAEGYTTTASGIYSHSEGNNTIAQRKTQHVFGEYNIAETGTATTRGNYVEIVGNGTADDARSNARTLDWNGNEVLAGNLTINGNKKLQYVFLDVNVQSQVNATGLLKEDIIADNFLSNVYQCVQLVNNSTGVIYNAYVRKDNGNLLAGETFPAARYYGQALLICT